eukprot:3930823-Rhodomonas_salina.3
MSGTEIHYCHAISGTDIIGPRYAHVRFREIFERCGTRHTFRRGEVVVPGPDSAISLCPCTPVRYLPTPPLRHFRGTDIWSHYALCSTDMSPCAVLTWGMVLHRGGEKPYAVPHIKVASSL